MGESNISPPYFNFAVRGGSTPSTNFLANNGPELTEWIQYALDNGWIVINDIDAEEITDVDIDLVIAGDPATYRITIKTTGNPIGYSDTFEINIGDHTHDPSQVSTYIHNQSVPLDVWTITHNLDKKPSVTVVDSADRIVIGNVKYIGTNSVQITFSGAFSGKAYLN